MTCRTGTDVSRAAQLLLDGGLVAFPTETVYGLGGNALDAATVARIFEVKRRPQFDPLIVHIADVAWLDRLTANVSDVARRLIDRFWPGPLSLVLPKSNAVPDLVTSGLPTVAVRMPDHPLALDLLRETNLPLAAPSANLFGRISPTRPEHVADQLGDKIAYILDGGACRVGLESTVLQLTGDAPVLLRAGGLAVEEIEDAVGPVRTPDQFSAASAEAKSSPGMLLKHYAPRTPLTVCEAGAELPTGKRLGLLTLAPIQQTSRFAAVEVLSVSGDLHEAAAHFFAALRFLDELDLDLIVAYRLPEVGLGRAMNDRLRRAAQVDEVD